MKQIIVKTQKQFNKIKDNFEGEILIKDTSEWLNINRLFLNAEISVHGNATIKYVYGNATIKYVYDNATIESVHDNATIKYVYDNATILMMCGVSIICFLYSAKKITTCGVNVIIQIGDSKIDMELSKETTFIKIKELNIRENPTIDVYKKLYPIKNKDKKLIMYKAVRKIGDEYISDYDKNFKYEIGKIKTEECDKNIENSCLKGIHASHLIWAYNFGKCWDNLAILELEINEEDIVVSKDCDGKVRASKVKVIRELNKNEY